MLQRSLFEQYFKNETKRFYMFGMEKKWHPAECATVVLL